MSEEKKIEAGYQAPSARLQSSVDSDSGTQGKSEQSKGYQAPSVRKPSATDATKEQQGSKKKDS